MTGLPDCINKKQIYIQYNKIKGTLHKIYIRYVFMLNQWAKALIFLYENWVVFIKGGGMLSPNLCFSVESRCWCGGLHCQRTSDNSDLDSDCSKPELRRVSVSV